MGRPGDRLAAPAHRGTISGTRAWPHTETSGLFAVSVPHDLVHLPFGVLGLLAARTADTAVVFRGSTTLRL